VQIQAAVDRGIMLTPAALATDRLQSIIQDVAHPSPRPRSGRDPKFGLLADDQHHLIIAQVFAGDADKCANRCIGRILFQLVQAAQALRQDYSRIESAAFGCTHPDFATVADQYQDVCVELLGSGRN